TTPLHCVLHLFRAYPFSHSFPTRRSSDLTDGRNELLFQLLVGTQLGDVTGQRYITDHTPPLVLHFRDGQHEGNLVSGHIVFEGRSEEHTSELQSRENLVCRLLLEKKK